MALKYKVTSKSLDQSNGNVAVTVDMWDDADPATICTDKTWANDLDDAKIAAWVAIRAPVLMAGAANAVAVTADGVVRDVPAVISNPKQDAIRAADLAFRQAFQFAQVKALNDPDALDKYNALQAVIADAAK